MKENYEKIFQKVLELQKSNIKNKLEKIIKKLYWSVFSSKTVENKNLELEVGPEIDRLLDEYYKKNKNEIFYSWDFYIDFLNSDKSARIISFSCADKKYTILTKDNVSLENYLEKVIKSKFLEFKDLKKIKEFTASNIKQKDLVDLFSGESMPKFIPDLSDFEYIKKFFELKTVGTEISLLPLFKPLPKISFIDLRKITDRWLLKVSNSNSSLKRVVIHGEQYSLRGLDDDGLAYTLERRYSFNLIDPSDDYVLEQLLLLREIKSGKRDIPLELVEPFLLLTMEDSYWNMINDKILERSNTDNVFLMQVYAILKQTLKEKNEFLGVLNDRMPKYLKLVDDLENLLIEKKDQILIDKKVAKIERDEIQNSYTFLFELSMKEKQDFEVESIKKFKINCSELAIEYAQVKNVIDQSNDKLKLLTITAIQNTEEVIKELVYFVNIKNEDSFKEIKDLIVSITIQLQNISDAYGSDDDFVEKKKYLIWDKKIREIDLKKSLIDKEEVKSPKKKI